MAGSAVDSRLRGVLAALLCLVLAACQASPLYQQPAAVGTGIGSAQSVLTATSIPPATDRLTQVVRNQLLFRFTGGGEPAVPTIYELSLSVSGRGGAATIVYRLVEIASGSVLASGSAYATAGFEELNQGFANLSAEEEATERAAIAAADEAWTAIVLDLRVGGASD